MFACVYSLLCLREGEAEGEGTEVRGAGMGHLRTGSSTILLLSISSIINSTETRSKKMKGETERGKRHRPRGECVGDGRAGKEGREGGTGGGKAFQRHFTGSI